MGENVVSITSKSHFDSILKQSKTVIADFYADWCAPCQQIAPFFESLAASLTRKNAITFVRVDNDEQTEIVNEYRVHTLPSILLFRDGKLVKRVQGANPRELRDVIQQIASEAQAFDPGSSSGSGSDQLWNGADISRGYSDVTDQVEVRNCELLNAEDGSAPLKVLFDSSKPKSLTGSATAGKDFVQSGIDDQLLLFIPLQSTIKLHTLQITSLPPTDAEDAPGRPSEISLFLNRQSNMDFGEADDAEPTQSISLTTDSWNANGTANIPLRFVKFQKATTLIIYVQKADGESETVRLDRIRLIGEAGAKRDMGKLQKIGDEPGE